MKGNVIVKIRKADGEKINEIFKENVEAENWADTDRVLRACMLDVINESPYTFTDSTGTTLMEDNGNVWEFEYEREGAVNE